MRSRPKLPELATAVVAAIALLVGGCAGERSPGREPAQAQAVPVPSQSPAVAQGAPLEEPARMVSRNGVLRVELVVERRKVEVGDRKLWALTYNGSYMPPTLRIRPGDKLDLAMKNSLDEFTNLHVHGLHVSPSSNSDNVFIHINPGETFHYAYRFPKNLAPGTYWYHSHAHTMSAPQVAGGMSGVLIVDGLQEYLPTGLRHITEHVIGLKDFQVEGDAVRTKGLHIGAPTNRTVNGQLNPTIRIRPGETQLWRLANISANIYYKLRLPGIRFHVIAQDGIPVRKVYAQETLVISAGARFDVLVQGGTPGTARLETLPYNTGSAGNQFPRAVLATVVTGGPRTTRATVPTDFAPHEDLSHATIAAHKTVIYTENKAGTKFFINGRLYDPHRIDFTSALGTVEEWSIRNNTDEDHSFHIHTNDFQLMSTNGKAHDPSHGWHDTVNVPARGNIVMRIHFTDFTGKTVLHCHILNHEDLGMMAILDIVRGDHDQ